MKLTGRGELYILNKIRERFKTSSRDIIAGIGDDSAVVVPDKQNLLLTTDMMAEGIHFDLCFETPYQIGFKLISVNVSDIYAMCGTPRFVLLNAALEKDTDESFLESFFDGIQKAMDMYHIRLIGGDLSSSASGIILSATLIGYAKKPVMRSGAKPGDRVYVTGTLGDSACGLELLKRINKPIFIEKKDKADKPLKWSLMQPLIEKHLLPVAKNPVKFSRFATSMIDISDGLFIDLSRMCDESMVGVRIYMKHIPISCQMKKAASALGLDPYKLATSGGEDYEMLFTAPKNRRVDAICIGEITESERVIIGKDGRENKLYINGFQHWH